ERSHRAGRCGRQHRSSGRPAGGRRPTPAAGKPRGAPGAERPQPRLVVAGDRHCPGCQQAGRPQEARRPAAPDRKREV
ncbi:MAG: hypothetical protein AVDCRST_MAG10-2264, partial [uncultured Acidimicrobiales bacterium]